MDDWLNQRDEKSIHSVNKIKKHLQEIWELCVNTKDLKEKVKIFGNYIQLGEFT